MGDVIPFPADRWSSRSRSDEGRWSSRSRSDRVETPRPEPRREPLWREAAGQVLRDHRHRSGRTLSDVASDAGISVQYLSEIERGRKEPSSEMLAAVGGALGLDLASLTAEVSRRLRGPVCLAA